MSSKPKNRIEIRESWRIYKRPSTLSTGAAIRASKVKWEKGADVLLALKRVLSSKTTCALCAKFSNHACAKCPLNEGSEYPCCKEVQSAIDAVIEAICAIDVVYDKLAALEAGDGGE